MVVDLGAVSTAAHLAEHSAVGWSVGESNVLDSIAASMVVDQSAVDQAVV